MSIDEDETTSQINGVPKRKSPFVQRESTDSGLESGIDGENSNSKHAKIDPEPKELPALLENEYEFVCDITSLISAVDDPDAAEDHGVVREEAASDICTKSNLKFQLVVYLTRTARGRAGSHSLELGLYVRLYPLDPNDTSEWTYRGVSFMVMLINASQPYSEKSVVRSDTATFRRSDACRGWPCMMSFTSLEELETEGFLLADKKSIICRAQAVCDIPEEPLPTDKIIQYRGLENQGATCYLNGLLQSLFHIGRLREILYSVTVPSDEEQSMLTALQTVFFDLEANPRETAFGSSEPLTEAFGWSAADVGIQQDVQEMNRVLIDKLETRLKELSPGKDEQLRSLFCGKMENYIRCTEIDFKSSRMEDFYDIQLNVVGIPSIENALREYLSVEVLEGQNAYDAGENRGKQRAEKGVRFHEIPLILTFQLMRFQFDFDTLEMGKVNTRFEFSEQLDMNEFSENGGTYKLYSVLVHSGGAHGGHYYAFVRPGTSEWYKFDDTVVERVSRTVAIEGNFGGPSNARANLYNYLNAQLEEKTSPKNRQYSAYMLMYVREDLEASLLRPVSLREVNPELAPRLIPPVVEEDVSVKVVDISQIDNRSFVCIVPWEVPDDWVTEQQTLKSSLPVSSLAGDPNTTVSLVVLPDGRVIAIDPSDQSSLHVFRDRHGIEGDMMIVVASKAGNVSVGDIPFLVLEFLESGFELRGILYSSPNCEWPQEAWWRLSGHELAEVQSTDIYSNGSGVLIHAEAGLDAKEFVEKHKNSHDIRLIMHRNDRPWTLGGVPANQHALVPSQNYENPNPEDRIIEVSDFDCRKTFEELLMHVRTDDRVLVFMKDPLLADCVEINHEREVRDYRNQIFHCLIVPRAPASPKRWGAQRPICVRVFDEHVVETGCHVVLAAPSETIASLISRLKPSHSRTYRLVDVDVHDCEIVRVYPEHDKQTLISTLSHWGASNIVLNSIRIEPDETDGLPVVWKCLHVDRTTRTPFGHPFLLGLDSEEECRDEAVVRDRLSAKLNVPSAVVKSWRFTEEQGTLMIRHPNNPFIQQTTSREKALFIRG